MTNNKKESKETKKVGNKHIQVEEKAKSSFHRDYLSKSELPGVVETKSLGEIKKPTKSDKL